MALPPAPPIPQPRTPHATRVRIYSGDGAGWRSVRSAAAALARLLPAPYVVDGFSSAELLRGGWERDTALLVLPGGADLPYARRLNGPEGNGRIRAFVEEHGGGVLGLCAGAYYLCSRVEWEAGSGGATATADNARPAAPPVVGDRELAFFPGIGRGAAFPGFDYATEAGAVAAPVAFRVPAVGAAEASSAAAPAWVRASDYCNGGPFFVPHGPINSQSEDQDPWPLERDPRFEVLARYESVRHPRSGERAAKAPTPEAAEAAARAAAKAAAKAAAATTTEQAPSCPAQGPLAAVRVTVGAGAAVLCATHPELAPEWLDPVTGGSHERRRSDDGSDGAASGSESDGKAAAAALAAAAAAAAAATAAASSSSPARQQIVGRVKKRPGDAATEPPPQPQPQQPPRPTSPLTDHTAALRRELEASQAARELFLRVLVYEALRR